jgi:hypothetical protein
MHRLGTRTEFGEGVLFLVSTGLRAGFRKGETGLCC